MKMEEVKWLKRTRLSSAIAIQGLPGVGNVGRLVAGYLIKELKAEKIAEIKSFEFVPAVLIDKDSMIKGITIDIYLAKKSRKNIIILTGDSQAVGNVGHYRLSWKIAEALKKMNVTEVVTIGGFIFDRRKDISVLGAVTDAKMRKKFEKIGVKFEGNEVVSSIVGEAGLVLYAASEFKIPGICLMGRVEGYPHVTSDPRAAKEILKVIEKYLNIKINMKEIDKTVDDLTEFIKRAEEIHEEMARGPSRPEGYIG